MSDTDTVVLEPEGRLDALGARTLWDDLEPLTHAEAPRVLVDMTAARYISSDGLRVLIRATKSVKQNGGRLVICCLNARISEIVGMAGLDRILEIFPTRPAAEQALDANAS